MIPHRGTRRIFSSNCFIRFPFCNNIARFFAAYAMIPQTWQNGHCIFCKFAWQIHVTTDVERRGL